MGSTGQAVGTLHFSELCSVELIASQCHRSGAFECRDLFSIVGLCSASIRLLLCDRVGTHTVNTFWMYNIAHKHRKKRRTLGGQGTCEYFCVHELCLHRIMHFMVWMNCVCARVLLDVSVIQGALYQSRLKATPGWERYTFLILNLLLILSLFVKQQLGAWLTFSLTFVKLL